MIKLKPLKIYHLCAIDCKFFWFVWVYLKRGRKKSRKRKEADPRAGDGKPPRRRLCGSSTSVSPTAGDSQWRRNPRIEPESTHFERLLPGFSSGVFSPFETPARTIRLFSTFATIVRVFQQRFCLWRNLSAVILTPTPVGLKLDYLGRFRTPTDKVRSLFRKIW